MISMAIPPNKLVLNQGVIKHLGAPVPSIVQKAQGVDI